MEFNVLKDKVLHFVEQDDYSRVLEICQQIIQLFPENYFGYNGRGNCKLDSGDYDGAIEDFQIALEKSPEDYRVLHNLGNVHYYRKEYAEAIKNYSSVLQHNPSYSTFRNRGNTYLALKEFHKAKEDFLSALSYEKDDFQCYNNLGIVYENIEDFEKAIEYYNKSYALNPDYLRPKWRINFIKRQTASRNSWENYPMSDIKIKQLFTIGIPDEFYKNLKKGLVPETEEDKWFVYYEDDKVYFHEAESGICVYEMHIKYDKVLSRYTEVFCEGDESKYIINESLEFSFFSFILFILNLDSMGPEIRETYIEIFMQSMTFDELLERFGRMLYD
jgi:tetratricopeptide (TPR) repeat protein